MMRTWQFIVLVAAILSVPFILHNLQTSDVSAETRQQYLSQTVGELRDLNNRNFSTEPTLRTLLTEDTFTGEDFAQESTLSQVKTNTDTIEDQSTDIDQLIGEDGRSTDSYGELITKGTTNLLNIPGHNPFTAERLRFYINDTRKLIEYNDIPEYTKKPDYHALRPDQGDTATLETAEAPVYLVHYEMWASWAAGVNRSLQNGDWLRIGMFNDDNGYFFEHDDSMADDEVDLVVRRNGTVKQRVAAELNRDITEWNRYELRTNWYNAGENSWIQTTTNLSRSDVQQNNVIGVTAPEGVRTSGPELPQLPLRLQVHRGSAADPIELEAGSMNILTAGDATSVKRAKTDRFTVEVPNASTWHPVAAIRLDPENSFVRGELSSVDLAESEAATDFVVSAQQHAKSLVLQSNGSVLTNDVWKNPVPFSDTSSIIEFTKQVDKAPNRTGDPVSFSDMPGGFQIGWGSIYDTGNKGSAEPTADQGLKRPIFGSDVTVFWVKADDDGNPSFPSNVTIEYVTEQDY